MPATSLYLRPDRNVVRGGSVATSTGTTDSAYTDEWIADEILGRPVKATNGTAGWTITFTSAAISGVAILNHNIDAARTIAISGAVSGTTTGPAARPNGVPYNALWLGSSGTGTTLSVSVASNTVALIIGEVAAGVFASFPGGGLLANELGGSNLRRGAGSGSRSVRAYDDGSASRSWRSSVLATQTELDDMMAWFESQKNGSLASLFVPDNTKNDVWAVELLEPEWTYLGTRYRITLNMQELPRERW